MVCTCHRQSLGHRHRFSLAYKTNVFGTQEDNVLGNLVLRSGNIARETHYMDNTTTFTDIMLSVFILYIVNTPTT